MTDTDAHAVAGPSTRPAESPSHLRWRYVKDKIARNAVWVGGLSVIGALMLIFVYLLSEVWPLFSGAHLEARPVAPLQTAEQVLYTASEEQGEVGLQVLRDGSVRFFDLHAGTAREQFQLPLSGPLVAVREVAADDGRIVAVNAAGEALILRHRYRISYPQDKRHIEPWLAFPYGEQPMRLTDGAPLDVAVRETEDAVFLAGIADDGNVEIRRYDKSSSFLSDEVELELASETTLRPDGYPDPVSYTHLTLPTKRIV